MSGLKIFSKIAQVIEKERVGRVMAKEELDNTVNLSQEKKGNTVQLTMDAPNNEQGYMTLLSEGVILYSDDTIRLYIAKGTLKKFYDSLTDDYEGYISTGHRDLNAYPVREGYFHKEDLKVVVDDNGRADLLVRPHVNTQMSNVRDIILQNEPFAISSEFQFTPKEIKEEELSEYAKLVAYNISKGGEEEFPITDSLYITGFSLVGNPGNAKSGGYSPSMLLKTENKETTVSKNSIIDNMLASLSGKPKEEEKLSSEVAEEKTKKTEEKEETKEVLQEEAPTEDVTAKALETANKAIEALYTEIEQLKEELASYKEKEKTAEAFSEAQKTQVEKLNALLEKFDAKVATPKLATEKLENDKTSIFGRTSIWEED